MTVEHNGTTRPNTANLERLVSRALELSGPSGAEIERSVWMAVHEQHHGMLPSEYDIREIDEGLYLSVLEATRRQITASD